MRTGPPWSGVKGFIMRPREEAILAGEGMERQIGRPIPIGIRISMLDDESSLWQRGDEIDQRPCRNTDEAIVQS